MKKFYIGTFIVILCAAIAIAIYAFTEKGRYSKEFAHNLFEYPLPPHTQVLEKHYFYGYSFGHLLGSGGYMPVVANMRLSTSLSEEEILSYYKNTPLFPYPNSNNKGVELELYLPKEQILHKTTDGFYYSGKGDSTRRITSYKGSKASSYSEKKNQQYILQISSSFDYIFRLDR
ncbi:hypothetical protein [Priestia megaterium]|uniref:hypothetical protein n=1 Tax=Priestia megaterium TaxID=1404 RepID=UPI003100E860